MANRILSITEQNGRKFLEIQAPTTFVAFPITENGIEQMYQELGEINYQINLEKSQLQDHE